MEQLQNKRQELETGFIAEDEPFVLVHGDFHGRNIIMQGLQVQVVLDWEFAGAYPLSEMLVKTKENCRAKRGSFRRVIIAKVVRKQPGMGHP